jgi:predicted RNA-binding Zn ribbon-like protein
LTATAGQSDWRDGFLFVGNSLALDFLNTSPVQNGETTELLPDFQALLRWFRAAGLLTAADAAASERRWGNSNRPRQALQAAREFRERLRSEVLAWEAGAALQRSTIDDLNRLMARHPMRTRIKAVKGILSKELWFATDQPQDLLAPLVYDAVTLFTEADRDRVRQCGGCVLHFHDTSKKGTRRWCSMRLCGNRLKVAAYAARRRTP